MEINLTVKVEASTAEIASKVVKSLEIDIISALDIFERSNLSIKSNDKIIELLVKASDISAAKASINSSLQWIENSLSILEKYTTS